MLVNNVTLNVTIALQEQRISFLLFIYLSAFSIILHIPMRSRIMFTNTRKSPAEFKHKYSGKNTVTDRKSYTSLTMYMQKKIGLYDRQVVLLEWHEIYLKNLLDLLKLFQINYISTTRYLHIPLSTIMFLRS
jgi:hypothetical protein